MDQQIEELNKKYQEWINTKDDKIGDKLFLEQDALLKKLKDKIEFRNGKYSIKGA